MSTKYQPKTWVYQSKTIDISKFTCQIHTHTHTFISSSQNMIRTHDKNFLFNQFQTNRSIEENESYFWDRLITKSINQLIDGNSSMIFELLKKKKIK